MQKLTEDTGYITSIKENISQIVSMLENCQDEEVKAHLKKAKNNLETIVSKEELRRNIQVLDACIANTSDPEKIASYNSSKTSLRNSLNEITKIENGRNSEENRASREKLEKLEALEFAMNEQKKYIKAKNKKFEPLPVVLKKINQPRKAYYKKLGNNKWDLMRVMENAETLYTLDKKEYMNLHNGYVIELITMDVKYMTEIINQVKNIRSQGVIIAERRGLHIYSVRYQKKAHAVKR
ncbi:hypothetical protein HCJ25_14105 [Listeria sp. FSL L7-1426]|uniref:hypothetical protein n=1 Tax=Listeria cossartiae TaxID=2838249 RepID=UPI001625C6F7|nr:hypothetical protein [Listeria cossartiae]MBC1572777.1 hypothetical protein [Listeria cossartiae subsp. cossartiae]